MFAEGARKNCAKTIPWSPKSTCSTNWYGCLFLRICTVTEKFQALFRILNMCVVWDISVREIFFGFEKCATLGGENIFVFCYRLQPETLAQHVYRSDNSVCCINRFTLSTICASITDLARVTFNESHSTNDIERMILNIFLCTYFDELAMDRRSMK